METVRTTSTHSSHKAQHGGAKDASSIANASGQAGAGDFMSMLASVDAVVDVADTATSISADLSVESSPSTQTDLAAAAMAFLGGAVPPQMPSITVPAQIDLSSLGDGDINTSFSDGFSVELNTQKPVLPGNSVLNTVKNMKDQSLASLRQAGALKPLILESDSASLESESIEVMGITSPRQVFSSAIESALDGISLSEQQPLTSQPSVLSTGVQKSPKATEIAQTGVVNLAEKAISASAEGGSALKVMPKKLDVSTSSAGIPIDRSWAEKSTDALSDIKLEKADIHAAIQQSTTRLSDVSARVLPDQQQWLDRGLSVGGGGLRDRLVDSVTGKKEVLTNYAGSGLPDAYALYSPSAADSSSGMADGFTNQLSQQVTYWVNQKVQNASFTMDRDGQPVEVSVALSGLEAQISFRSDQAQTREMLDASTAQLKELMLQQGLSLTGVSIGAQRQPSEHAASDQFGETPKRSRIQGVTPATQESVAQRSAKSLSGTAGGSGYRLDVFA